MSHRFFHAVLLALLFSLVVGRAEASIVWSDIVNGFNRLEDDDFEILVNAGNTIDSPGASTVADVGDYLVGMMTITTHPQSSNSTGLFDAAPTFTGLFVTEILSKSGSLATGFDYVFGPAGATAWTSIGMPVTPNFDETILILYGDPDNLDPTPGTVSSAFATVDGDELLELGFGNPDNAWIGDSLSDDIADAALLDESTPFGSFKATLDVLQQSNDAATYVFADRTITFGLPNAGGTAQVFLTGTLFPPIPEAPAFDVTSDAEATFVISAVIPEPVSAIVWCVLAGACFGTIRRR